MHEVDGMGRVALSVVKAAQIADVSTPGKPQIDPVLFRREELSASEATPVGHLMRC